MSSDNLIESIFDKVVEEKRNNTPIPANEDSNLLSKSIDIELSQVEENKDVVGLPEPTANIESQDDSITNLEQTKPESEEMIRDGNVANKEKKSKCAILCASLSKLLCRK
jgi:hypothetical protein